MTGKQPSCSSVHRGTIISLHQSFGFGNLADHNIVEVNPSFIHTQQYVLNAEKTISRPLSPAAGLI